MICLNSTTRVSNGNGFIRVSEASIKYGLHQQTIRRYCNQGLVECARIPGGWRKVSEASLRAHLGYKEEEGGGSNPDGEGTQFIYTRVSSQNQLRANNKSRQRDRLLDIVEERTGITRDRVKEYTDCGSAWSCRSDGLNPMVIDITTGKIPSGSTIWIEYTDRLARNGQEHLIYAIAKHYKVSIIVVDKIENDKSVAEEMAEEVIMYMTIICNKASSRKSAKNRTIDIPTETLKTAYLLKKDGLSDRSVEEELIKRKMFDGKGKVIKRATIGNRLRNNWEMLEKMYGGEIKQNSFQVFVSRYITKTIKKNKVSRTRILKAYQEFCKMAGLQEVSLATITRNTLEWRKVESTLNHIVWGGISLNWKGKLQNYNVVDPNVWTANRVD